MTDEYAEEAKWRKQQIRMHALQMAVESARDEKGRVDVVQQAIRFENYIFRGTDQNRGGGNS